MYHFIINMHTISGGTLNNEQYKKRCWHIWWILFMKGLKCAPNQLWHGLGVLTVPKITAFASPGAENFSTTKRYKRATDLRVCHTSRGSPFSWGTIKKKMTGRHKMEKGLGAVYWHTHSSEKMPKWGCMWVHLSQCARAFLFCSSERLSSLNLALKCSLDF